MDASLLAIAIAAMAGLLFYAEHSSANGDAQALTAGWFLMGLLVRIMALIVAVVLLMLALGTLLQAA
jgi:uncharacterized membrane protein